MSAKTITHPGFIRSINGNEAKVVVLSKSGCASCEINGSCSVSDVEEKIIDVSIDKNREYKTGQEVVVEMKQSQGTWAVLLAYIFPIILVIGSLVILTSNEVDEGISGLISLGILIPYYSFLYFTRSYVKKNFEYYLK